MGHSRDGAPPSGIPHGTKTFQVYYRYQGWQRRLTLGRHPVLTLATAREMARVTLASVIQGNDPAGVKKDNRRAGSFAALAQEYIESKKDRRRWKEEQRIIDVELLPNWASRKAIHIERRDVERVIQRIMSRDAPIAANHALGLIRRIFNFAIDNDWLESNPSYRIKRPATEKERDRVLTPAEIKAVWEALDGQTPSIRAMLRLQLLTAQRIGEIRQMRRCDVDLDSGWWTIPSEFAKNKKSHRVPLSEEAITIVKSALEETSSVWVFPSMRDPRKPFSYITIHSAIRSCLRAPEKEPWSSHDLRRTVVTHLMSIGFPRTTAMKILNHTEPGVIQVYDRHSYDREKVQALNAWARELKRIVAGEKQRGVVVQFAQA